MRHLADAWAMHAGWPGQGWPRAGSCVCSRQQAQIHHYQAERNESAGESVTQWWEHCAGLPHQTNESGHPGGGIFPQRHKADEGESRLTEQRREMMSTVGWLCLVSGVCIVGLPRRGDSVSTLHQH